MNRRALLAGAALSAMVLLGGGSVTTVAAPACASPSGFGQHTSEMAREHGGMAAATAHHNQMHGTSLTVGEHQQQMRAMCGEMSGM